MSNITEVITKKLKLFSKNKVITLIDGNYDSVFRGRGIELDSLREYVMGDNIKDIDWAATARTDKTHTRQYTALRDQRILLIVDSSKSMLLEGHLKNHKLETAFGVAVLLGSFVKKNRDLIAVCSINGEGKAEISRYNNTSKHIESILRTIDSSVHISPNQPGGLTEQVGFTLRATKKRTAIFVISDQIPNQDVLYEDLKKLIGRHQVFYIQVAASWPFSQNTDGDIDYFDIEQKNMLNASLLQNKTLQKEWLDAYQQVMAQTKRTCNKLGVAYTHIQDQSETAVKMQRLFMEAKRYATK